MASVTLTTIEDIKARLGIPASNTDQDAVIDAYREAVEEEILAKTGFTFVAGSRTDTFTDWQRGTTRLTSLRPILSLGGVQGRVNAPQAGFQALGADVKNARDGRVLLVGWQNAYFDPRTGDSYGQTAGWFKWREYIWPIVTVGYAVDPLGSETNPLPKALKTAALESVAALMARPAGSGALQSVSIEKISESYGQGAKVGQLIAPAAVALLARYTRDTVTMQT